MPVLHYLPRLNGSVLCGATTPLHATLDQTQTTCAQCLTGLSPSVSEAAFQAAVRRVAAREGWLCYCTYDSRKSPKGYPDLTLVRGEYMVIIELKTETGVTTLEQARWLEALAQVTRVECGVVRPADFQALVTRLMRSSPGTEGGACARSARPNATWLTRARDDGSAPGDAPARPMP